MASKWVAARCFLAVSSMLAHTSFAGKETMLIDFRHDLYCLFRPFQRHTRQAPTATTQRPRVQSRSAVPAPAPSY